MFLKACPSMWLVFYHALYALC
uniref:Uncharacterized protein n=1 Tax=Rhizophora mucronata TaxID=61149 RepID=A0A2P2R261_RHIMU